MKVRVTLYTPAEEVIIETEELNLAEARKKAMEEAFNDSTFAWSYDVMTPDVIVSAEVLDEEDEEWI